MFDRLGEVGPGYILYRAPAELRKYFQISSNHEVYLTDLDHDEVPALFWWFPNQDDYRPAPPADETTSAKLERISQTIKVREKTKLKIQFETSLSRFEFLSNIF